MTLPGEMRLRIMPGRASPRRQLRKADGSVRDRRLCRPGCRPSCGRRRPRTIHAPARADHAAVLDDRVADRAPHAVGDQRAAGAEAARDRAVGPGPERDLADLVEAFDPQGRVPEPAFLGREALLDGVERPGVVAGRELGVEARAPQIDGLFEPVGGEGRRAPRGCKHAGGCCHTKNSRSARTRNTQAICECANAHLTLPNANHACGKTTAPRPSATATLPQVFHRGRDLITVLASEKSLEMLANRDSAS